MQWLLIEELYIKQAPPGHSDGACYSSIDAFHVLDIIGPELNTD